MRERERERDSSSAELVFPFLFGVGQQQLALLRQTPSMDYACKVDKGKGIKKYAWEASRGTIEISRMTGSKAAGLK